MVMPHPQACFESLVVRVDEKKFGHACDRRSRSRDLLWTSLLAPEEFIFTKASREVHSQGQSG